MTRTEIALLVSSISLGIALATFVWRIAFDIYLDAPRIKATLEALTLASEVQKPEKVYAIAATNEGRHPTTVTSLWLTYGRPRRWWWRPVARLLPKSATKRLFARTLLMPGTEWAYLNTTFPKRLAVGGQAHVYYARDLVDQRAAEAGHKRMYAAVGVTYGHHRDSRSLKLP